MRGFLIDPFDRAIRVIGLPRAALIVSDFTDAATAPTAQGDLVHHDASAPLDMPAFQIDGWPFVLRGSRC